MLVVIVAILAAVILTSVLGAWFGLGLILIDLWGNNRRLCVTILAGLGLATLASAGVFLDNGVLCPVAGILAGFGLVALGLTRSTAAVKQ